MSKGAIIGVGNVLQQDDGIGVMLINYLEANFEYENSVSLVDGGTCGSALASDLVNVDWTVVLDAVDVKGNPGDIRVYSEEQFINSSSAVKMTPHQINFLDLIQQLRLEGTGPQKVSLIGVIPKSTDTGTDISEEVIGAIPKMVEALLNILDEEGIKYSQQLPAREPDYWWIR